jgi:Zn-dependent protease
MTMNKKEIINLLILLGKIFAPIGKLLVKLAKMAKLVKLGLISGSAVAYAYMFTWQFGLIIMTFLFVHEYGHVWAMKKCGIKTKGMYFIPFFGAVAVASGEFKSYKNEVYSALMGPIWGMVLALAFYGIYFLTDVTLFAGAAIWMFFCTLFNMLPIMPLDGGRVMRCVTMSFNSWAGIFVFVIIMCFLSLFMKKIGIGLFLFFLIIGGIEVLGEGICLIQRKRKILYLKRILEKLKKQNEIFDPSITLENIYTSGQATKTNVKVAWTQHELKELEETIKPPMSKKEIFNSILVTSIVVGLCLFLMFYLKHIPGADMALQILQDKSK